MRAESELCKFRLLKVPKNLWLPAQIGDAGTFPVTQHLQYTQRPNCLDLQWLVVSSLDSCLEHNGAKTNEKWREVMREIYVALRSPLAIFAG